MCWPPYLGPPSRGLQRLDVVLALVILAEDDSASGGRTRLCASDGMEFAARRGLEKAWESKSSSAKA